MPVGRQEAVELPSQTMRGRRVHDAKICQVCLAPKPLSESARSPSDARLGQQPR